jgi:uncharacterized protein (DUF4415 family)
MKDKVIILDDDNYDLDDDVAPEYDLENMEIDWAQTNKMRQLARAVAIELDPELVDFFKTSEAINEALRRVMREMQADRQ